MASEHVASEQVTRIPGRRPGGDRAGGRTLQVAALVVLYGYLAALVLGPHEFLFWREFGLQNLVLGMCCAYGLALIVSDPEHRSWRIPLLGWPSAMFLGNLLINAHAGPSPNPALTAASIAVMLPAYPCALIAVVQLNRGRWAGFSRAAALDFLVAALAIWAAFMAFVLPPAEAAARVGKVNFLFVLAFPICDLTVLSVTVAAVALSGMRPERMSGWVVLAIVIFGLGDSTYAIEAAVGNWRYGTVMDGIWVVGSAVVALGAMSGPPSTRTSRTWGAAVLIVPLLSAAGAITLLVIGTQSRLDAIAVALAAAAAAVSLLRLADAYAQVRGLAETQRLAATDDLTALANRRAFYRGVEEWLERGRPFAVLLIDLDRFKEINDTLGHGVGDELLHAVARRLESGVPPASLLARLGGDEFAACVSLASPSPTAVIATAEQLLGTLRGPFVVGGRILTVGASLGVAIHPLHADDRTELMRRADVAMYAAKRAGGGVRVHVPGDDALLVLPQGRSGRPWSGA